MASSHLGGARPHLGVEIDHSDLFDRGKWGGNHGISHYAMLGLDRHATEAEVKRAFHQLSRKWHPDKNPEAKERADAIFKVIKEAYETLQDPAKRKRYDLFERVGAL
jgi:DnaJ-class molecular chaperone